MDLDVKGIISTKHTNTQVILQDNAGRKFTFLMIRAEGTKGRRKAFSTTYGCFWRGAMKVEGLHVTGLN